MCCSKARRRTTSINRKPVGAGEPSCCRSPRLCAFADILFQLEPGSWASMSSLLLTACILLSRAASAPVHGFLELVSPKLRARFLIAANVRSGRDLRMAGNPDIGPKSRQPHRQSTGPCRPDRGDAGRSEACLFVGRLVVPYDIDLAIQCPNRLDHCYRVLPMTHPPAGLLEVGLRFCHGVEIDH